MNKEEITKSFKFVRIRDTSKVNVELDGAKMKSQKSILEELYVKFDYLDFLQYANYDGFQDLIYPGDYSKVNKMNIFINNSQEFLASNTTEEIELFFKVMQGIADMWNDEKGLESFLVYLK